MRLDADSQTAAVLELDWSGPEPSSVADLGDVAPLRLTHHSWNGALSYCNHTWALPRSHKVIGVLPLLHDEPSNSWALTWCLGDQLTRQRRWDNGLRNEAVEAWKSEYTGEAVNEFLDRETAPRSEITHLTIRDIDSLDCTRLVRRFPEVVTLHLRGRMGLLSAAGELNKLSSLQEIAVADLFGMTGEDRLRPRCVPKLESLDVYSIPAAYASATRKAWRSEIAAGTYVSVLRARKPEWVEENRNNPLRDWDGREHIGAAVYKRAVTQYKTTRNAVLQVFAEESSVVRSTRMEEIGRTHGEAFNQLDRRSGCIETVEREELFDALDHLMNEVERLHGGSSDGARADLVSGVESVRDW